MNHSFSSSSYSIESSFFYSFVNVEFFCNSSSLRRSCSAYASISAARRASSSILLYSASSYSFFNLSCSASNLRASSSFLLSSSYF